MNTNTTNIMTAGFECLIEKLGYDDTQKFIDGVKSEGFDYTEWRRDNLFEGMTLEELNAAAVAFEEAHPHEGNGKRF